MQLILPEHGEFVSAGVTYHQPSGFFLARLGRRRDMVGFVKDMLQHCKCTQQLVGTKKKLEAFPHRETKLLRVVGL